MLFRLLLLLALAPMAYADAIHSLVMQQQREAVLAELRRGVSIDLKDRNGETPLHWAVRHGHPEMVRFLLEQGASPDLPNPYGQAPLYHAKSVQLARPLLERGADPSRLDHTKSTPLHQACLYNRPEVVTLMIQHGAHLNQACNYGVTPLLEACHFGSAAVIDLLLRHGASLDTRDKTGTGPLQMAARSGSLASVQRLVEAGVDPADPEVFWLAVGSKNPELVDYLASRVDPRPRALESAIAWGRLPLFQSLLTRGGSLDPAQVRWAAQAGQVEILTWLLDQGQSVESPNQEGQTALMLAAGAHCPEVIHLLLGRGARAERQDGRGQRPADYLKDAIRRQQAYIARKDRSRAGFTDREQALAELAAMRKTLASVFGDRNP